MPFSDEGNALIKNLHQVTTISWTRRQRRVLDASAATMRPWPLIFWPNGFIFVPRCIIDQWQKLFSEYPSIDTGDIAETRTDALTHRQKHGRAQHIASGEIQWTSSFYIQAYRRPVSRTATVTYLNRNAQKLRATLHKGRNTAIVILSVHLSVSLVHCVEAAYMLCHAFSTHSS